jgi:beta-glucosidase-like glycosyl hydrolase
MAAWRTGSPEVLAGIVAATSRAMRACGINLTLSPVADVNSEPLNPVIGTRAFGQDPEEVSDAVRIAVRTMAGEGILSCLKHFPGHGAAALDSHLTLPVIGRTFEELCKEELPPFIAGIEEGADTVMTAHIALTEGGPPASLDREIVTGILKGQLGFGGVVITDALEMAGALAGGLTSVSVDPPSGIGKPGAAVPASVAAMALGAGNDLLLMSRPLEEVFAELAIHSAALGDEISTDLLAGRMEESAERIASLRDRASSVSGKSHLQGDLHALLEAGREKYRKAAPLQGSLSSTAGENGQESMLRSACGSVVPVFLGAGTDFASDVVRRFIIRVLEGPSSEGRGDDHPDRVSGRITERFFDPDDLCPVMNGGGLETGLYLFEPVVRADSNRVLFILCRKPPPEDVIRAVAAGYDSVVAAERPWDAALLPPGTSVVLTYGIYDAAADRIAEMLRGGA